ncbi:type I-C CRISPR-associated protein Cas8c/Csd1, partial [Myxococcus llanfairpwllgwyngyllgogerychwyrndrobwllllantysiliogogogochensis]
GGMGARLVSFRAPAFSSHGLEQGANAPISKRAALGYVLALNHLLDASGARHFRQGIRLAGDTVLVLWTDGPAEESERFLSLVDPTLTELKRWAESSMPVDTLLRPGARLYGATLSGKEGRAVVRDMLEAQLAEVVSNVRSFHAQLRLGGAPSWPVPVWALLRSLEGRAGRELSPELATRFARCILTGEAFPAALLTAALTRMAGGDEDALHLETRAGLIRACLHRSGGAAASALGDVPGGTLPAPFVLGRLFAVLEQLDGGSGFRERHFARCSHTPSLAFPALLQRVASNARNRRELVATRDALVTELLGGTFPGYLNTEGQALVALGYAREAVFQTKSGSAPKRTRSAS